MSAPRTSTSPRGLFISLRLRLIVAFTLVFTLFAAAASAWAYTALSDQIMRAATAEMVSTLEGAAAGVAAAELQALAAGPVPLRADGYPDDARYWRQVQWLATVRQIEPRAHLYTFLPGAATAELIYLTCAGALDTPPTGVKFLEVLPAGAAADRLAADLQGLITTTVQTGPGPAGACAYHTDACVAQVHTDPQGQWLSAYTPIKNVQGQTVAALGVDFDARQIQAAQQSQIRRILVTSLLAYVGMLVLIGLTSALTARPAQRLVQAVRQLGQGCAPEALDIGGLVQDEISTLAEVIRQCKVLETALRESEARFRRIFEMSPLGAAVVELDFRFSRVNEALCRMLGYTADELLQLSFPQVTHPDDLAENRAQVARLLRGEVEQYTTEKRYLRKDGSTVWAQVWLRLTRNPEGQPLYFLPLVYDLSEQRQAEQRYQEIFDGAVEGIFQSLPDGRFHSVNPAMARIYGYASPETMIELVGSDIAHRIHANPQTRSDFMRRMQLEGQVRDFEAQNCRQDGSVIWTRTNARTVRDESGAVLYYEGFVEEITSRKAAEEEVRRLNADLEQRVEARTAELRQANMALTAALRVKSEFLSMMSHELRTPLVGILGLAQVLAAQVYGPLNKKQTSALVDLQESGQQLRELISDVLDFASTSDGGLPLDLQTVEVGPLVQGAVRSVTPAATRKQLRVLMDRDTTVRTVRADAHRLRQMLIHLLHNAVKFTPAGGAVGVEVALADYTTRREARFTVWDTGIGVAPADQERIFEPFVQLDSGLARRYGGSGLGLALVRRLAELHGGRVTVESAGVPGRGSRFSLYLPWSEAALGGEIG